MTRSPAFPCVLLALACAASSTTLHAQSLTRLQAPGGRQIGPWVRAHKLSSDDRYALATLGDGIVPGDANGFSDPAWFDLWTGDVALAVTGMGGTSVNGDAWEATLSANGRYAAFSTYASNIVPGDNNGFGDAFWLDHNTGQVRRVSIGPGGVEPDAESTSGNLSSGGVSDDGRFVLFSSEAQNFGLGPVSGSQIYLRDLLNNTTELISVNLSGLPGDNGSDIARLSSDARYVAFFSQSDDLVPGDTNQSQDVFLRDRQNGTTVRLNLAPGGIEANGDAYYGMDMTPDAHWIVFDGYPTNLVPGLTGNNEIFLIDVLTGQITLQSKSTAGVMSDGDSYQPEISADGQWIAFSSDATTLDPVDTSADGDVFLRNASAGTTRMISISIGGNQGTPSPLGGNWVGPITVGRSGRRVGFESSLQGLVAGDTNDSDAFLYDRSSTVPPIESYCTPKVNSLSCTPRITSGGEPHLAGPSDNFFLSAHGVRSSQPGLFLWSSSAAGVPFYGGTLCLGAPVRRTVPQNSGGPSGTPDCSGTYSFHFSKAYMASKSIGAGLVLYGQYWSRDQGFPAPNNVGLTDAIRFTTAP